MKPEKKKKTKTTLYTKAPWNFPVGEHFDVLEQWWTMSRMESHGKWEWKL